jgi:hypothetical protein
VETSEGLFHSGLLTHKVFVFQTFDITQYLRGKRLVDLPQSDIVKFNFGSRLNAMHSTMPRVFPPSAARAGARTAATSFDGALPTR